MKTATVKIEELKPSEYNPRKWESKATENLKKSILEFGIVDPIIVNSAPERKNIVIGGHFRLKVAKELNIKTVPVVYVSIPDIAREKELNIRLNKNLGEWDRELLANFEEDLLKDIGFADQELDEIFGMEIAEEFDVEKEIQRVLGQKEKRVNIGDIWQLGDHKLIIGSCTDKENWKKLLEEERFDFLLTDPPYRLAYSKNRVRKVKTKGRKYLSVGETDGQGKSTGKGFGYRSNRVYLGVESLGGVPGYNEWLSFANEYQNSKGVNVMIFENWRNTIDLWFAIEKYWKIKNIIIWHLPNRHQRFSAKGKFFSKYDIAPLAGEGQLNEEYEIEFDNYLQEKGQELMNNYEIILYGSQGDSSWGKMKGRKYWQMGDVITQNAMSESQSGQNVVFGTKPIQILVPYIKILSPREGIVMDCFAGSGSTIIASEIMKRKCRAIEIEPIYAEVILNRWERFTGKQAQKI